MLAILQDISPFTPKQTVGPNAGFLLVGGSLRTARGDIVAMYRDGYWHTPGHSYLIVRIETPLTVQFSAAGQESETYGPYRTLQIVSNILGVGERPQAIAQLDAESDRWRLLADQTAWSAIALRPEQ